MVASGAGAPSLAYVEILSAPNSVTSPRNFSMARGQWLRTRLIVGTCFGVNHNALDGLNEFGKEMSVRETELEEYTPTTRTYAPRYWCSSSDMRRSAGRNGLPLSGARYQRCPFQTLQGSGQPWRIRSPGILPAPPYTPSPQSRLRRRR